MAKNIISQLTDNEYQYGFVSDIDMEEFPKGLNEDIIRLISKRKNEPEWLLEFRLKAFSKWKTMKEPEWAHLTYQKPNYNEITYLAIPKKKNIDAEKGEINETLIDTFNKLGISLDDQKKMSEVAVDAVIDSISVKTTFSEQLEKEGIIFC